MIEPWEGRGPYMRTYPTGRHFHPFDPRPEEVHILDIATSLANTCRYRGHVKHFYSVAQHSVLMAEYAAQNGIGRARQIQQIILLHDAREAYSFDIPGHWHEAFGLDWMFTGIHEQAIAPAFNIPAWEPSIVTELDKRIRYDEVKVLRPELALVDEHPLGALGIDIKPWSPELARHKFLSYYLRTLLI